MGLTACSGIESNNLSKYTNMNKKQKISQTTEPAIAVEPVLAAGISYTIGKFQLLLNESTGTLRVIVHTNSDSLKIQPKSDNSIVLHACR